MLKQSKNQKNGDTWCFSVQIMKKSEFSVFYPTSNQTPVQRVSFVPDSPARPLFPNVWEYEVKLSSLSSNIYLVPLKDPNDYFKTGETVLVFTSSEPVGDYLDRILKVENTMMQEEPMVTQYPAYEGDGMITVNRTTVIDPDGNIVEINQILDGLDLDTEGF